MSLTKAVSKFNLKCCTVYKYITHLLWKALFTDSPRRRFADSFP